METKERLQKFLARAGVASRRHAEELIAAGRVKVNGVVLSALGSRVDPKKDLVVVDGRPIAVSTERAWFLLYKPPGVVTTLSDPQGRSTVAHFIQSVGARIFPVGRLDFDAEGALLLTNDGETANLLMHPSHEVPRVYLAKVKGMPDRASLDRLLEGIRLEDGMARALEAKVYETALRNTWIKLVVAEGRQHLVKRLFSAIGHPVVRLFRPFHAGISVRGLRPGDLRPLTADEVRRVKAVASGQRGPEPELLLPARRHGADGSASDDDESNDMVALRAPQLPADRSTPPTFGAGGRRQSHTRRGDRFDASSPRKGAPRRNGGMRRGGSKRR